MSDIFKKILIATDGSQYSRAAVEKGVEIARFHGSTVYALYVIDSGAFSSADSVPEPTNMYQLLEHEGQNAVAQVKKEAEGLTVETAVLTGHPSSAIVQFAKDNGVDLIVMGTLGKSGIQVLLLGSVADKVIRTAPCPVLVVRSSV